MEYLITSDLEDGINNFNLMVICLKDLIGKNYDNRLELVERFANYAIIASEKFENYLSMIEQLNIKIDANILEMVDAIDAAKAELWVTYEKLITSIQCYETLEEEQINQMADCIKLLESLEICKKVVNKKTENETESRSIQKTLLISAGVSAITLVGLLATGPLLYGALGPAQASIDNCVKAKELAEKQLNKKRDELEASTFELATTEQVKTKHLEQIQLIVSGIFDQTQVLKQFRTYRHQLNTISTKMFSCLRLVKMLTERHSLLIHECPLAAYSLQCIVFSVHLIYDIMKEMELPVNIEELHLPSLPQVPCNTLDKSTELIPTDLSIQQHETMFDLLLTVPCAMYSLHSLSLNIALATDNHDVNKAIVKGTQMLCKVLSQLHSSMDFLHCLINNNMQLMLTDAGHQILDEIDDEADESPRPFEMFETFINCLQVESAAAAQKMLFNKNWMTLSLEYWSLIFQQLIQGEHDSQGISANLETVRENIAIQNELSQRKQMEMRERKEKIDQNILETENKFHEVISEVRCDKMLLAVDISIELTFDIIFCFIPFMKAAEFISEAAVVCRYLLRKIQTLAPAIKRFILSALRKKQNGSETEDTPEDKHHIYKHCGTLEKYIDDFRGFINDDGRLVLTVTNSRQCELKWKLISFLDFVYTLPECNTLGVLMAICFYGLSICESLEVLELKKIDFTTPEADQVAEEIQNFITTADEFILEANAFENGAASVRIKSASWFDIFLNGFTGYKAKHKLFLTQTISECLRNEENRLKPIKRDLRKENMETRYRKLNDPILQIRHDREESRLNSILETQEHLTNMTQVWGKICTDFGLMEILFKRANERMASIHIKSSSSKLERYMSYQQAFEGVKMFEELSKFTKVYLKFSNDHFMPMLTALMESIDYEGKDSEWINIHSIAFEDKMISFAIEYSKL